MFDCPLDVDDALFVEQLLLLPSARLLQQHQRRLHDLHQRVCTQSGPDTPPASPMAQLLDVCSVLVTRRRVDLRSMHGNLLQTGVSALDAHLGGGLLCDGGSLTEVVGESASGKTQFCLQLCVETILRANAQGGPASVVYLCTEDRFPLDRLRQLAVARTHAAAEADCVLSNVYVEHLYDLEVQQHVLYYQLPEFLRRHPEVRLVIVDSIAANFRYGNEQKVKAAAVDDKHQQQADGLLLQNDSHSMVAVNIGERVRQLQLLAAHLKWLGATFDVAIVCVNQVTTRIIDGGAGGASSGTTDGGSSTMVTSSSKMVPSLGLAWTNSIQMRIGLERIPSANMDDVDDGGATSLRQLSVAFAPHACARGEPFRFRITPTGIQPCQWKGETAS